MIALVLALAAAAGPSPRTEGKVVQATATRAYLDAGSDDGLAVGAEIALRRGPTEVARCRIEAASLHAAACAVAGAPVHAGDRFALPAPPKREEPRLLAPPTPAATLAAQGAALAAAPIALVQYQPPPRASAGGPGTAEVELTELAWFGSGSRPWSATAADLSIRSMDVGLGMKLDVDARAIRWTSRPSDPAPRFRPNDKSQLYVWQAALSRDPAAQGAVLSLGRILPWRIPGATIFDGATAGWRGDRWELGAFAGFVPEPSTLAFASDRAAGGGYWGWDHLFESGVFLRDEGRLALVRSPELGTRFEAETRADARLRRALDASGSVRFGVGGDVQAPGKLDAARLELSTRPVRQLRLAAWGAYDGLAPPKDAEPSILPGHSRRLEASAGWEERNYRLTAVGGVAKDLESGLDRSWIGPVIDLPRLFLGRGGLSLGYLEELGWADGRSAWIQAIVRPWERFRVLARFSWAHAQSFAVMQDDVAATLGFAAELTRVLSARLTATVRGPIDSGAGDTQGGIVATATVAARL